MNKPPSKSLLSDRERRLDDIRMRARKGMETSYNIRVERERLKNEVIDCYKLCQLECKDKYKKLSDLKDELDKLSTLVKQEKEKDMSMNESNNTIKARARIHQINVERNSLKKEVHDTCNRLCKDKIKALSDFNSKIPTEREKIFNGETKRRRTSEAENKEYQRQFSQIYNNQFTAANSASEPYGVRGGKIMIYTGPKNGKYIIKNGSKVYIDRKSLTNNFQYKKKAKPKNK